MSNSFTIARNGTLEANEILNSIHHLQSILDQGIAKGFDEEILVSNVLKHLNECNLNVKNGAEVNRSDSSDMNDVDICEKQDTSLFTTSPLKQRFTTWSLNSHPKSPKESPAKSHRRTSHDSHCKHTDYEVWRDLAIASLGLIRHLYSNKNTRGSPKKNGKVTPIVNIPQRGQLYNPDDIEDDYDNDIDDKMDSDNTNEKYGSYNSNFPDIYVDMTKRHNKPQYHSNPTTPKKGEILKGGFNSIFYTPSSSNNNNNFNNNNINNDVLSYDIEKKKSSKMKLSFEHMDCDQKQQQQHLLLPDTTVFSFGFGNPTHHMNGSGTRSAPMSPKTKGTDALRPMNTSLNTLRSPVHQKQLFTPPKNNNVNITDEMMNSLKEDDDELTSVTAGQTNLFGHHHHHQQHSQLKLSYGKQGDFPVLQQCPAPEPIDMLTGHNTLFKKSDYTESTNYERDNNNNNNYISSSLKVQHL
eukprot:TRINITY_DN11175_c0_g1_i1.p1 TRINITY_DN11175_c0_g1~~TRINITY_DN11175_c0_g1_i1.p1  ORF type:complete len:479 (-),score=113.52 TRINITY_DN11175_c0_g1_i1:190-1590(-)